MDEGELRSHLECPVCTMVPHSTKILACKNSHQICQVCYDKIKSDPKSCPQGRCKFSSPPSQLRAIEEMISQAKVKLNCKNSRLGCQVELKKKLLVEHELECEFRIVPCPEADCQMMMLLSKLEQHCQEDHFDPKDLYFEKEAFSVKILVTSDNIANAEDCFFDNTINVVGGFDFWRVFMKKGHCWYTWVGIKAGLTEAAKWKFSVRLGNKKTDMSAKVTGRVAPIDWTVKKVLQSGCYLTLTRAAIEGLTVNDVNYLWLLKSIYMINKTT